MPSVLVFDDDPDVGGLVADLVRSCGLTVEHHLSAVGVVDIVRAARPQLVLLDVMMPGVDGLSACHAIRSNPATRHVKTIMLTSKSSQLDQEAAKRYGATMYVTKPFTVDVLSKAISSVLGLELSAGAPHMPAPPITVSVLPGGVVLEAGDFWVILDAGAGVGKWVETRRRPPREAWVLLTRYAPEVMTDLEGIGLLLAVGAQVRLAGPQTPESPLASLWPRLARKMGDNRLVPSIQPLGEGEMPLPVPGAILTTAFTLHPGTTMAYRLTFQGRSVVYCPAHNPGDGSAARETFDFKKFCGFFGGAELLIHGYARSLRDRVPGAAWESVLDQAAQSGVASVILVPLPGAPSGTQLDAVVRAQGQSLGLNCRLASAEPPFVL